MWFRISRVDVHRRLDRKASHHGYLLGGRLVVYLVALYLLSYRGKIMTDLRSFNNSC